MVFQRGFSAAGRALCRSSWSGNAKLGVRASSAAAFGIAAYVSSTPQQQTTQCQINADNTTIGTAVVSGALGALGGWFFSRPAPRTKDILVVCGPSGVGKGTLIQLMFEEFGKSQIGFSVSHTTRKPRQGEQDGVHYHFKEKDLVRKEIAEGKFVESAEVHGNIYGTSIQSVRDVVSSGKVCILDIDCQGVEQVKKSDLDTRAVYFFIAPPNMAELESRLRGRGTETEDKIAVRLKNAKGEMDYLDRKNFWTKVFVNDSLPETASALKAMIREACKVK